MRWLAAFGGRASWIGCAFHFLATCRRTDAQTIAALDSKAIEDRGLTSGSVAIPHCTTKLGTTRKKREPLKKSCLTNSMNRDAPTGAHSG